MVEVTLVEFNDKPTKGKACWFPFQKQIKNRRALTNSESWNDDKIASSEPSKFSGRRLCRSRSSDEKYTVQGDRPQKNSKTKSGAISIGNETDATFQSVESLTTARTGFSSQETHETENATTGHVSPKDSELQNLFRGRESNKNHRGSPTRNGGSTIEQANPQQNRQKSRELKLGELLPVVSPPKQETSCSARETNCSAKEVWTDEVVDDGAFACISSKEKKRDSLENKQQKMQFISQDPEDTNEEGPLRRILCSGAPFQNQNKPILCRTAGLGSGLVQTWRKMGSGNEERSMNDEEPNFFVEVEAVQDQLKGIRDLESVESESVESESVESDGDIVNARSSSLIHEDSSFINSAKRRQKQPSKKDNRFFQTNKRNSVSGMRHDSRTQQPSVQAGRGPNSRSRQERLISEMVSDRVLAMRAETEVVSNSMERNMNKFNFAQTKSLDKESLKRDFRDRRRGLGHEKELNDHSSGDLPPKIITPEKLALSPNPLNISELTEMPQDQNPSKRTNTMPLNIKCKSDHKKSYDNTRSHVRDIAIGKGDCQTFGEEGSKWNDVSREKNNGSEGGKFNDSFWNEDFWKEDSDLDSAAFETFGSENDSVFDGLKSQSSVPGIDADGFFISDDPNPFTRIRNPKAGFSKQSEGGKRNSKLTTRTTYLQ